MKAYLASGWFTEEQEQARLEVLAALKDAGIDVYSPKEDLLYVPGQTEAHEVFSENIMQLSSADLVVASTEGKDMGTIFECGAAFVLNVPIVYYYKAGGKFNLMLSESAIAVFSDQNKLKNYLTNCENSGIINHVPYTGEKE